MTICAEGYGYRNCYSCGTKFWAEWDNEYCCSQDCSKPWYRGAVEGMKAVLDRVDSGASLDDLFNYLDSLDSAAMDIFEDGMDEWRGERAREKWKSSS